MEAEKEIDKHKDLNGLDKKAEIVMARRLGELNSQASHWMFPFCSGQDLPTEVQGRNPSNRVMNSYCLMDMGSEAWPV